jgi:hypothetical protein
VSAVIHLAAIPGPSDQLNPGVVVARGGDSANSIGLEKGMPQVCASVLVLRRRHRYTQSHSLVFTTTLHNNAHVVLSEMVWWVS